ncbi:hypothetical protein [Mucilaginibacter pocheonensis]|uniref:Uncharacterized protein n=1 Tax=Mucilaginibacter pocheonensis TaxID=398050 RepID=A0ABU1TCA3_9SPHI|nr:hypothetical protein [Mucilaginibacter pocheonensis]MDR6943023.1 hypothetical protein [Mucilaginibacter pocheonensis]
MKKTLFLLSFLFISVAGFSQTYLYQYDPNFPYRYDGVFLRNQDTGEIFIVFEGKLRYIQTIETLNGLFVNAHDYIKDVLPRVLSTYTRETPVSQVSGFVRYTPNQRVYLREGTLLRWISSIDIAHQYNFNLNIAENVTSLSGYTIGSPILY